jgi:hypothetical protein
MIGDTESNAKKRRVKEVFEKWCKTQGKDPSPDSFIEFDASQGKKWLDYEKAKEEGFYFHLRMQAASVIASWATLEPLRTSAGKTVPVKTTYVTNGKHKFLSDILESETDLTALIADFQLAIENKTERLYGLLFAKKKLSAKVRKQVQASFAGAEQTAFNKVTKKDEAA